MLTVYFVRAFDARDLRDLGEEHRIRFTSEFAASQEERTDWSTYLAIEDALAAELEEGLAGSPRPDSLVDRYAPGSLTFPGNYERDWNRSYALSAPSPRGVAVLLHGLTDSPYTMRKTAQTLADAGFTVVVPRMPGHGFAVSGLLQARWEDWTAAARLAVRHALSLRTGDQPLLLVGYSNGGLLAIDYALRCAELADLPCPAALVLLSPAIDVTAFAAVADWHAAVSWMPFFEKFKWFSVLPEIDPFKFTSFPKQAAWELHEIAARTRERLGRASEAARLPPMLTFQSVVDNTISAESIVTELYTRLPENGSELIVYDINRNSTLLHLLERQPEDVVRYFEAGAPWKFAVTILGNRSRSSFALDAVSFAAGLRTSAVERTDLSWPSDVYSLSHIAVPFGADDPVYGNGAVRDDANPGVVFGALAPRGEEGVLQLGAGYFLRTRYNPFFDFQERRLVEWLTARLGP